MFIYIVSLLMLILPVPGRLACGIVILLLFNLIVCAGALFYRMIFLLKLEKLHQIIMVFLVLCLTIFYKQLITLFSPVLALVLGNNFFIAAFCAYEINMFSGQPQKSIGTKEGLRLTLTSNMRRSLFFSVSAFLFFFVREILGYGALSLPAPSGMIELTLPFSGVFATSLLWASTPGAVLLAGVALALSAFVYHKMSKSDRRNADVV